VLPLGNSFKIIYKRAKIRMLSAGSTCSDLISVLVQQNVLDSGAKIMHKLVSNPFRRHVVCLVRWAPRSKQWFSKKAFSSEIQVT
jgi:hypothetical protein